MNVIELKEIISAVIKKNGSHSSYEVCYGAITRPTFLHRKQLNLPETKTVSITQTISRCRDCYHSTNSSRLHDCAFTSAPHPVMWYCEHPERKAPCESTYIYDENKIDKHCPL